MILFFIDQFSRDDNAFTEIQFNERVQVDNLAPNSMSGGISIAFEQ